jgi:hypothetical protein
MTTVRTVNRSRRPDGRGVRALGVAVALAATLGAAACGSGDGDSGETAAAVHTDREPAIVSPVDTAITVAHARYSWTPAKQSGPWDMPVDVVEDSMTGGLRATALKPPAGDTPGQWKDWASAGATVAATITSPHTTAADDTTATVTVTVQQDLMYPDGSASTWKNRPVSIHLVTEAGQWKADSIKEDEK